MKPSEEIVREMRSEWPDRQTGMIADLRVDVAGCPVVVKGESARDHLEAVNRDLARLRLDNARLRAELAVLPRVRAEGWRTMESAPRDGTEVLVSDGRSVWSDRYEIIQPGAEEGWPISVTHWRPLPPPPDAARCWRGDGMTQAMPDTPTPLHGGADMRCETLMQALRAVVYERGAGLPVSLVVGVMRLLEHEIIGEQRDG